jgi:GNAT superfamily N-acetyltransferase
MISPTSLEITRPGSPGTPPVLLAPFGEREFAGILPIDPASAQYERDSTITALLTVPAGHLVDRLGATAHTTTFGIYTPAVAPANFTGIVELTRGKIGEGKDGAPIYTKGAQGLGMHIYPRRMQGRGLGTTAMHAALRYAMQVDQTRLFIAQTSEHNHPMQHVLAKLGFVHGENGDSIRHYDKTTSLLQKWYLVTPHAMEALEPAPAMRQQLARGYSTFSRFALQHEMQLIPTE